MKVSRIFICFAVLAAAILVGTGFTGCSNSSSSPTDPIVEDPAPPPVDNGKADDLVYSPGPGQDPDMLP